LSDHLITDHRPTKRQHQEDPGASPNTSCKSARLAEKQAEKQQAVRGGQARSSQSRGPDQYPCPQEDDKALLTASPADLGAPESGLLPLFEQAWQGSEQEPPPGADDDLSHAREGLDEPPAAWPSPAQRKARPGDLFDHLNHDCCNMILGFLDPVDLLQCERVRRSWKDYVRSWMELFGIQLHFRDAYDMQSWIRKDMPRHQVFKGLST
jgi:hypothetical protein